MSTTKRGTPSLGAWTILTALAASGCAGEPAPQHGAEPVEDDHLASVTTLVAIINPVVNMGHATTVPFAQGSERDGIPVDANPGSATTSKAGLAPLTTGVGAVELHIGNGLLGHSVLVEGSAYDAAIAYNGGSASYFEDAYIHYPVGKTWNPVVFEPSDAIAEVQAELGVDSAIVVLREGTYAGDLTISGSNTLLIADPLADNAVVIDGSVTVTGEVVHLRGLTITGDLVANGPRFGLSLSTVKGQTLVQGDQHVFLRNVLCGPTDMAVSSSTVLDNYGLDPIPTPPMGACD